METAIAGETITVVLTGSIVRIEMECGDAYAARVFFDDIYERTKSADGAMVTVQIGGEGSVVVETVKKQRSPPHG